MSPIAPKSVRNYFKENESNASKEINRENSESREARY